MAAHVEEPSNEMLDDGDHDNDSQDHGIEQISDAAERLPRFEMYEEQQLMMPDAGLHDGNYDRDMDEAAEDYDQDPRGIQNEAPYYDDGHHEMNEQYSNDPQYQAHDYGGYDEPEYYQERYDAPVQPQMTQQFAEDEANRARAASAFERVAAYEEHGSHEQARYAPDRDQPFTHESRSKTAPYVHGQPKTTKKSSRKRKKPPASLAQASIARNNEHTGGTSYPTPVTEHRAHRGVHFSPRQHEKGFCGQRQDVPNGGEAVQEATHEHLLPRKMQPMAMSDKSRPLSAGLRDQSAINGGNAPPSPPPTRPALSRSATRPVSSSLPPRDLAPPSMIRHHATPGNTSGRLPMPQTARHASALAIHRDATPSSDPLELSQTLLALGNKVDRDRHKQESRHRAEQDAMKRQLGQASYDTQVALNQCRSLQHDNQGKDAELRICNGKIAKYRTFKTFVDKFGHDLDYFKSRATDSQKESAELIAWCKQRITELDAALKQSHGARDNAGQLEKKALKACSEARSELSVAAAQHAQLRQELDAKDKLLVEEKNLRSQLQAQLSATGHDREALVRQLKSNNDAVLNKLYEMHGTLEESNHKQEVTEMLEKITTAVQGLTSRPTATVEDVVAVKVLVASLPDTIATRPHVDVKSAEQSTVLRTCIEESLDSLKAELLNQEKLAAEASACRETIAGLNEKLRVSEERLLEHQTKVSEAQAKEKEVKELNATLKSRITELESSTDVEGITLDLQAKASALITMQAELDATKEELGVVQAKNASREDELNDLKQQLKDHAVERAAFEKDNNDALEKNKSEMGAFIETEQAKLKNEQVKCEEMGEKLKETQQKLRDAESELERVKKISSEQMHRLQVQLTAAGELAQSRADEIQTLCGDKREVNTELQKEKSTTKKLEGKVKALEKQIEAEKDNRSAADSATESAEHELETCRAELTSANKRLEQALEKSAADSATEFAERELAAEHELEICRAELASANEKLKQAAEQALRIDTEHQENEAAHHDRLQKAESAVKAREQERDAYAQQVEDAWTKERADQQAILESEKDKTQQAEAERDKAQAAVVELQSKLDQLLNAPAEHETGRIQSKGVTPNVAANAKQPRRPRKRVNRNTHSIEEGSTIPVPVLLRPSSARPNTGEGEDNSRGPVVEESQQGFMAAPTSSPPAENFNLFEVDRSAPKPRPAMLPNLHDRDVVPETQFDDVIPSVRDFHKDRFTQSKIAASHAANHGATSQRDTAPDFRIYEDADEAVYGDTQDAPQYLQNSLPPIMPPPNSSSKLVRRQSDVSHGSRGSRGLESGQKKASRRNSSHLKTPEPTSFPGGAGIPNLSSSPGFMPSAKPVRASNTYNSGSGKEHRTSRRQSDLAEEPATNIRAPPKRKSESAVIDGYERERSKRIKPANVVPPTPKRPGLRSMSQPAGTENSHAALMSDLSIPPGPPRGSSQTSRMQTLAGKSARPAHGVKATSKRDQMNARFQQELNVARR